MQPLGVWPAPALGRGCPGSGCRQGGCRQRLPAPVGWQAGDV